MSYAFLVLEIWYLRLEVVQATVIKSKILREKYKCTLFCKYMLFWYATYISVRAHSNNK